ncbi:Heterogeneous nuclear ribonucleoprotein U-like protein 1 [Glycine soja]
MMVGLPASGKTTWAEKWVKDHPEKRYVLLGTNSILDQMKVPGLLWRNNYGERFDLLMDRATRIFNVLLSRAANIPRNYIIDQTNVYKSVRKPKLEPFADYQKFAVVVFPKPEELKIRYDKRFTEMGKEVPPDAVNKMIVRFGSGSGLHLPGSYSPITLPIYGTPGQVSQVNANDHVTELNGSMNSFSGVYPGSQIPHVARAPTSCEPYSNKESSCFARDIAGYNQTYGAILTGDIRNYNNSVVGGPYRPNIVENNMVSRDAFPDAYVSGMNEPSPIASARAISFDFSTCKEPYPGAYRSGMNESSPVARARAMSFDYPREVSSHFYRGIQPDLHTRSPTTFDSLSPYGTPTTRPTYGSSPINTPYSGRYASQRPR